MHRLLIRVTILQALVLGAPLCLASPVLGREDGRPRRSLCDDTRETLPGPPPAVKKVALGAVIGAIEIHTLDIFDSSQSGQNRHLYRAADNLHVKTREGVVRRRLLLKPGEPFDARKLQESERHLRALGFFYDACVEALAVRADGSVDILVVTRDVWTLGGGGGFQRQGGGNTISASLRDTNFLGTGRHFLLKYTDDPDRRESVFRFDDPAVLGTRVEISAKLAERSDGHRYAVGLGRPFYALDSRWSAGTGMVSDEQTIRIYSGGEVVERFNRRQTLVRVHGGLSPGYLRNGTRRLRFGYSYQKTAFIPDPRLGPANGELPPGRTLSYPWVGFQKVGDGFIERHNLDLLGRTEDLNLGTELRFQLGYSARSLGASKDQAIIEASASIGHLRGERHVFQFRTEAYARLSDATENARIGGQMRYFFRTFGQHQLLTVVQLVVGDNLDLDNQLLIGGERGLRGYGRNASDGDTRFLFSVEHRFYTDLELFHLVHVGAAVFFDAGEAWYRNETTLAPGLLRDVGFGLRLSSSRSSQGTMVHFDVAYPLDGDSRKIQWSVTSKATF